MEDNIGNIIKRSLYNYEVRNNEFREFIEDDQVSFDRINNKITFIEKKKIFRYNVLGMFDKSNNIWFWGWMMPLFYMNEFDITTELLNYGLKINPTPVNRISNDKLYIKTQLINSRFLLENFFQLEIHLALSCFLVKDKIKFVYPRKRKLDNNKDIILYYFIY
jgi:hypothetical protein